MNEIERIISEQGWNDETVLILLWGYVNNQQSPDAVLDYFLACQEEENEDETSEECRE